MKSFFRQIHTFFIISPELRKKKITQLPQKIVSKIYYFFWNYYFLLFTKKIPIRDLSFNVVYGCNLGCDYCSHISQLDSGFVPIEDLRLWFNTWNKKVAPFNIFIIGGEPLLHPQIEEIIYDVAKYWKHSKIHLWTNGLLFGERYKNLFDAVKVENVFVHITKHFDDPDYNQVYDKAITYLTENKFPYEIGASYVHWRKAYTMSNGTPIPYVSNYKKAWNNCSIKNNCPVIMDNMLFRCEPLSAFYRLATLQKIPDDWNRVLTYQPLKAISTRKEIIEQVNGGAFQECSVCPEKYEYVPTSEVSSNFHKICIVKKQKQLN